jgi:hypothetical protein
MLQVDPTKRIRIDDLLQHRWVINSVYPEPVKWESIFQVHINLVFCSPQYIISLIIHRRN